MNIQTTLKWINFRGHKILDFSRKLNFANTLYFRPFSFVFAHILSKLYISRGFNLTEKAKIREIREIREI